MIGSSSLSSLLPMNVQLGVNFSVYLGKNDVRYVHDLLGKFRGQSHCFRGVAELNEHSEHVARCLILLDQNKERSMLFLK